MNEWDFIIIVYAKTSMTGEEQGYSVVYILPYRFKSRLGM